MVEWLVPVSIFWILAAVYLGGAPIRFEGARGPRQLLGLLLHFVLFLVLWAALRAIFRGMMGSVLAVVFATILASIALPLLGRIGFRLIGVRISKAPEGAGQHAG